VALSRRATPEREVTVRVQGSQPYLVEVWLEGDDALMLCDCPYAEDEEEIICKHKVAVALYLQNYLQHHKPQNWQEVLTRAVRPVSQRTEVEPATLLFFSLQTRGASWAVVPYVVSAGFFPEHSWRDAAEAARVVETENLSSQAVKLNSYETHHNGARSYANVTRAQASLVKLLSSSGMYYGNYYAGATLDFETLFAMLEGGPLYFGTDKNPLKRFLTIMPGTARLEMEFETNGDGIRLRPSPRSRSRLAARHEGDAPRLVAPALGALRLVAVSTRHDARSLRRPAREPYHRRARR
jgi:hypothetical protein